MHGVQQTLTVTQKALAEACEQRSTAQAQSVALSELRDQARLTAQQAGEQCQALQDRLQRAEVELGEAQRSAAAQEARAQTLDVQLGQLRDTLQQKRRQRS